MHEKNLEIGYLLDFYGELLNERRRTVLDMYYNNDMSLAEIASVLDITRQGARDLIKKAGDELLLFEERLGAAKKFRVIDECASRALTLIETMPAENRILLLPLIETIQNTMKE